MVKKFNSIFNVSNARKLVTGFALVALATLLCVAGLAASSCAQSSSEGQSTSTGDNTARLLNFKPESAPYMKEAAAAYEQETGNKVIVDTAANGQYSTTLTAKMTTNEAPTVFVLGGQKDLETWKNYITDITDSWANKHMNKGISTLKGSDGKVYGVPFLEEGYGIIYNKTICNKYFALTDRQTQVNSMEEIKSFEQLKTVTEDMQKLKDEIGIKGAFASTSLKTGHEFRWQTHLMNLPITQEFEDNNVNLASDDVKHIQWKYSDNYKQIFDLYINNSITAKKRLGTVAVTDSMTEFALGECAMVQNGNWSWDQIKNVKGTQVSADEVAMMPIYMGLPNEQTQGLAIGTENYYAINSKATKAQQENGLKFIEWLYSSDTGKDIVVNKLKYIAPFDTMGADDVPSDPLGQQVVKWMNDKSVNTTAWDFTVFPSQNFKNKLGQKLLRYAQEQKEWAELTQEIVDLWDSEYNATLYE